jgi:hypothetical protein
MSDLCGFRGHTRLLQAFQVVGEFVLIREQVGFANEFEGHLARKEVARPDQVKAEVRPDFQQFLQERLRLVEAIQMTEG